jgi:hypothetical protein
VRDARASCNNAALQIAAQSGKVYLHLTCRAKALNSENDSKNGQALAFRPHSSIRRVLQLSCIFFLLPIWAA